MKRIIFLPIVFGFFILSCTMEKPDAETSGLQSFSDSLFNSSIDSMKIAGASVLVFKGEKELLNETYGYASLELSVPMPDNASFEIGSVTKQFTAAAILRLYEEGKLSLEDDFTDYVDFNTGGRKISVSQLLHHTSGIASYTEIPEFWGMSVQQLKRDSLVRLAESKDFLFEPGQLLIYNNTGYFLLGLIIEKASGMTYEDYLSQEFFQPLGMNNTYYCSESTVVKNKVYGYNYSEEGLVQKPYLVHTWPFSAGSLCSTAEDLLTWLQALHGGEIFDEESYRLMLDPAVLNDGSKTNYAMGLVNDTHHGHPMISHGGGIHGFLSETRYFPEEELYIICLINTAGPVGAYSLADDLTWKILEKQKPETSPPDYDHDELTGSYVGQGRGRMLKFTVDFKNDTLLLKYRDQTDTVTSYLGDGTWTDGSSRLILKDDQLRIIQSGGYYILNKER